MKQIFYLSAICIFTLAACTGAFKKGDKGLEYKIISDGKGKALSYGNFIQIHIKQVYSGSKDTVLLDTREYMPKIQLFDSVNTPLAYFKIIRQMKKGDSLIIRLLADSAYSGSPQGLPPFMKKGKFIYTHVKLVNIFETEQEADSANKAESIAAKPRIYKKQMDEIEKEIASNKQQLDIDSKIIQDYLAKNNIKAQKTKWGTYVSIVTEGTGEKLNNNQIATVNYTGKTLDSGKVFDSNIDPQFKHVQPMQVNLSEIGNVILGWTDALMQLKNGTKATVYIPSSLGYGKSGNGGAIKPNENLVFDIEVKEVINEAEFMAKQKAMQQEMQNKMMEAERLRTDSLQKVNKK